MSETAPAEQKERKEGFAYALRSLPSENHPGRNEDSVLAEPDIGLFGVFDGVGGHAAGREASAAAAAAVHDAVAQWDDIDDAEIESGARAAMANALRDANRAVIEKGNELYLAITNPDERDKWRPPGTTAAAVKVHAFRDGRRVAYIAHCGDSRVYALRKDGRLEKLTTDHDMLSDPDVVHKFEEKYQRELTQADVQKYRELLDSVPDEVHMPDELGRDLFRSRNVIASSLGFGADPRIGTGAIELAEGDLLLLCSDGLTDNLAFSRIADKAGAAGSPEELVEGLTHEAYEYAHLEPRGYRKGQLRVRSHRDDITALAIKAK